VLQGSTPTSGIGTWSLLSGPAGGTVSFDDIHDPNATVTLTPAGAETFGASYRFQWSVVSGTCAAQKGNVFVLFNRPATATVQGDFNTCVDATALAAIPITGTVGGGGGPGAQRGRWEIVTGTGRFTSNNASPGSSKLGPAVADSYKPSAADYTAGSVKLRLVALDPDGTGVNGPCGDVISTTLTITFDKIPGNINAGPDQTSICTGTTSWRHWYRRIVAWACGPVLPE